MNIPKTSRLLVVIGLLLFAAAGLGRLGYIPGFTSKAEHESRFERSEVAIVTQDKKLIKFKVELARTDAEIEQGLMRRKSVPENTGMLFVFPYDQIMNFWMRNTLVPLDMLFLDHRGRIINIVANTTPESLDTHRSAMPGRGVLEIRGGGAAHFGIRPGDRVLHPLLQGN